MKYKIFFIGFDGKVLLDPNHEYFNFESVDEGFDALKLWCRMDEESTVANRQYLVLPVFIND